MFVQVIRGPVADAEALRAADQRWHDDLAPGATGWVSSTSGITADGTAVIFACFESAEAARANSERPEQGAWWAETERCFAEPPAFADFDDVIAMRGGVNPAAGFVQAMYGQVNDPARERELNEEFFATETDMRPDLIGGLIGIADDGRFAQAFYFSSEAEARIGEQTDVPEEIAARFAEEEKLITEINYLDLTEPVIRVA